MNVEQLTAFDRIVREGSFSRAAWSLQIAQPTISARIRTLEEQVGGPLFERTNRAVTLTERGVQFLPFARQALDALRRGLAAAAGGMEGEQGELRVGVLRSVTGGFVAPAVQRYLRAHAVRDCFITESNHWQLVEWLHDGQIELAIVAWPPIGPHIAEMTPLLHFREPMVLLAHRSHPLAGMARVTQEDVARLSNPFFILRWWQVTPETVMQLARRAAQMIDVPTDTGRYLLAKGMGAGFFNRSQTVGELMSPDLVEIRVDDLPPIYRDSALVRLTRNSTLSAAATNFVEQVRKQAAQLDILRELT